jgi:sugar lactone lactonase YvrE
MPTANGIKVKDDGIYVSNSLQKKVLRIKILPGGNPGAVQVIDEGIAADDFDVDAKGNIFLTTHPFNTIIHIEPGQPCAVIADITNNIVGPTAAVFGRAPTDRHILYVVTDGGFSRPYPGAKSAIVAIDTSGKSGALQSGE